MINKKISITLILLFGIFFSFLIYGNFVIAQTEGTSQGTYCAERTLGGAWCLNVPLNEVDQNFRFVPTSCESTSYCKPGTCVDSQEGTCMENTPQRICELPGGEGGGVWFDKEVDEVPQCQLGCCLIGDEAAFVTQTRCKQLSSLYGLETNYRTDIQSEVQCITTATSQNKGACVFERDFERTCKFTTREECQNTQSNSSGGLGGGFHEDFLCSAESLGTNCGPSEKTTLVDGKDEIYFTDTCGNLANVYDAARQNDKTYWEKIVGKAESCGIENTNGNAGSSSCGNCNYFLGSTGKRYDRGIDPVSPQFGDFICRDLGCDYNGEDFKHGETWCDVSSENEENKPGSRYHRLVCYNGEVSVEACSDFRQEVCIQDSVNDFKTAACRVNKWQDCISQTSQKNCENTDRRDCQWLNANTNNEDDEGVSRCVPKYSPGFDFWTEGDAESLCLAANNECIVRYEKGLLEDEFECVENCECLGDGWAQAQNNLCVALGDCGATENYLGHAGYNDLDDLITISEINEEESSGSSSESEKFP
tara:strand:- start:691 stop:2295 length:1605 start_codon:yes stop_codon:yes gene_type:complete